MVSSAALCAGLFAGLIIASPALAQDAPAADSDAAADEDPAQEIVVTGVSRATNRLDTSVSVSAISADAIAAVAPRGTSEIFRRLPGIRAESSAGGGNSNMQVRGLPAVTGGAQFISLQEDGLPVLLFGDHNFAPADGFVKVDSTLARVESVRGGSAATLTTNGNGAIINLINKTGKQEGGSVTLLKGVDYKDSRIDAEYGARLADDLYFHVGGHYQIGGDYRHAGLNALDGGKIRASLTKEFTGGFIRLYGQLIDKKDATYMPQPVRLTEVSGSVASVAAGASKYGTFLGSLSNSIAGLDARDQTLHSPNLIGFPVIGPSGNLIQTDLREGIHTKAKQLGGEFEMEIGDGFIINNKFRYSDFSGEFIAPFTHAVDNADNYLRTRFGAGATAVFQNGVNAGKPVTSASLLSLTGNNLITEVALFDTEFNSMGNVANDLRLTKTFKAGSGEITLTGGYFKMVQDFEQTWHWGRILTSTDDNAAIINVPGFTESGVYTYNGAFGACCNILWDMQADVDAVYGGINATFGALNLDGSVRREHMGYSGFAQFSSARNVDINKDGTIGPAEVGVPINDPATRGNIGGGLSGTSYSFGANYRVDNDLAVFARYSRGTTWNFDRQFGAFSNGAIALPGLLRNSTRQIEAGVKWRETGDAVPGNLSLYLTYFNGRANLRNFSITTNATTGGIYKSNGVELEFNYDLGAFNLYGNAAYTKAKSVQDFTNPARSGLTPIRQADIVYNIGASYTFMDRVTLGGAVNGTSSSFVDFENRFKMPGYAVVTAFLSVKAMDNLTLSLNANNLFNATGFTEGDETRLFDTNANGAYDTTIGRSITGRTISASAKFDF
jgi:outer membrane receptor protein involved in Fe transport